MNHTVKFTAFLFLLLLAACNEDKYPPPDKDKYIYDIPQVDLEEDARVGVYYQVNDISYWTSAHTGTPVLGNYNSLEPAVFSQQLQWMEEAGVDFLIYTWDGKNDDNTFINNFVATYSASRVKLVINYNTSHLKLDDKDGERLQDADKTMAMVTDFGDLAPVMESDAYYKVAGKPVVLVTPLNFSSSKLNSADYSQALPHVRSEMASHGMEVYLIGEFNTGWTAPVNFPEYNIAPFDAVTLKDWSTNDYDRHYGYFSFIDLNWKNWTATIGPWGTDFVPCIFPSYNNREYSPTSRDYRFGQDGKTSDFVNYCNLGKINMSKERIIIINSWNDYRKGTNLEPSLENEGEFITVCRQQLKVN